MILLKHLKLALYEICIEVVGMNLIIRAAKASDESSILFIRNQPENYKWFFHQASVKTEEHANWFRLRLSQSRQLTLVAEENNSVIGVAYLTESNPNMAVVSISIHPKSVGKGNGSKLLKQLIIRSKSLGLISIYAEIMKSNSQSIEFFLKNGFTINSFTTKNFENSQIEVVTLNYRL